MGNLGTNLYMPQSPIYRISLMLILLCDKKEQLPRQRGFYKVKSERHRFILKGGGANN